MLWNWTVSLQWCPYIRLLRQSFYIMETEHSYVFTRERHCSDYMMLYTDFTRNLHTTISYCSLTMNATAVFWHGNCPICQRLLVLRLHLQAVFHSQWSRLCYYLPTNNTTLLQFQLHSIVVTTQYTLFGTFSRQPLKLFKSWNYCMLLCNYFTHCIFNK